MALGQGWTSGNAIAFVPFRAGICPGPHLTRTPRGLMIDFAGYDSSGAIIFRIQNNQFSLLQGDYLHIHRPSRSSLGLYGKNESEIFFVRYLAPGAVRIRGRFLCGDIAPQIIADDSPMPPCSRGTISLGAP